MVDKQAFDAVVTREFSATGRQRRWDAVSGETSISSVDASGATTSIPGTTSASSACGGGGANQVAAPSGPNTKLQSKMKEKKVKPNPTQ
jgi:hypothetical protein